MNYYWNWHWWSTILGLIHNALELQWDYDEEKTTLRSRCMMGVWQWCRRDTASHMSQNIRSTSRSVNPVEIRSFICEITEPATETAAVNAESVSQNKNINVVYQRSDYLLTITSSKNSQWVTNFWFSLSLSKTLSWMLKSRLTSV